MKDYSFESGIDVFYLLTSPLVISIVSATENDTSTLHTYIKQMILDPIFPAMKRTSYNSKPSFFDQ